MIVSVTRDDLRDEFTMADEAFALSPISARAAQPREEDYDAIREAFMETSRGRWFLSEYAKRNRNADTRMVLDAVARIEQTIAAQKAPPPEPDDVRLTEALAAIKASLVEARTAATIALGARPLGRLQGHVCPAEIVATTHTAGESPTVRESLLEDRRKTPNLCDARQFRTIAVLFLLQNTDA